jgi:hypothetical protein
VYVNIILWKKPHYTSLLKADPSFSLFISFLFLAAYRSLTIADQYFLVEAAGIENESTVVNA